MVVGVKAGTDVRLRVINSASTTNYLFRLTDGEAPVSATLFALDGQLISPFDDSEWWLATAQVRRWLPGSLGEKEAGWSVRGL